MSGMILRASTPPSYKIGWFGNILDMNRRFTIRWLIAEPVKGDFAWINCWTFDVHFIRRFILAIARNAA
jgi:hypothetical protein